MRIGLVSLIRGTGPRLAAFADYYRGLGVDCLYLFLDDPNDVSAAYVSGKPGVVVVPVESGVRAQWRECVTFAECGPFTENELIARQMLNVEIAIGMARVDGLDWLLHLDDDEKLVTMAPLPQLLAGVPHALEQVWVTNDEGIPERDDAEDPFADVTLFRRNPNLLSPDAVDDYLAKTARPHYFLAYTNGKSAARVRPGLLPRGSHGFTSITGPLPTAGLKGARLLHYPYWSLRAYLQKADHRQVEPDSYLAQAPVPFPFQLMTRTAARAGDSALLERYFRELVMLTDVDAIAKLIDAGTLYRHL